MAAMAEGRMNLAALQQRDPYISDIVDTATQVALYTFSSKSNEWEKTSIEGTLFVYKRSASPFNGFMILNRLGLNNWIEPITKDLEFQLQDPFLLYRNAKLIYGIWFYDKDECARIGQLMNSLVQVSIEHHRAKTLPTMRQRRSSESDTMDDRGEDLGIARQVNIIEMLSKAQHEYDQAKVADTGAGVSTGKKMEPKPMIDNPNAAATKTSNLIRPKPLKVGTGQSAESKGGASGPHLDATGSNPSATTPTSQITLEALFRNASISHQTASLADVPALDISKPIQRSVSLSEPDDHHPSKELHPTIRQLMSTGSMVEDIERQQRGDPPASIPENVFEMDPEPNFAKQQTDKTKTVPSALPVTRQSLKPSVSPSICLPFSSLSDNTILPGMKSVSDMLPTGQVAEGLDIKVPSSPFYLKSHVSSDSSSLDQSVGLLTPGELEQSAALGTDKYPVAPSSLNTNILLSPMAFIKSSAQTTPVSSAIVPPPAVERPSASRGADRQPIAALTQEQMQQALIYLIKNDPEFLSKLHEAYLKSLNESLASQWSQKWQS